MAVPSEATYALLKPPSFDVIPDTDIVLGTLLPRTKSRPRRPDVHRPLNGSSRAAVPTYNVINDPILVLDSENLSSAKAGIWAHLPVLENIGGSTKTGFDNGDILYIEAKGVETQSFLPDAQYIAEALKKSVVAKRELFGIRRPSVFLVTGLKIAETAVVVTGRARSADVDIGPEVDLTQYGIPLQIGLELSKMHKTHTIVALVKKRFVLAFETRRIRIKKEGFDETDFNKFALLDDAPQAEMGLRDLLNTGMELNETVTFARKLEDDDE